MQNDSGQTWAVGTIANGHVMTDGAGWVRLNPQANHAGPWRAGDVVNDHVSTGTGWVALPAGWRPDPAGRHQFRWWTGHSWTQQTLTNGLYFNDPIAPVMRPSPMPRPTPLQNPRSSLDVLDTVALVLYCGFWLFVAIYSASIAVQESDPRYLALTSTASLNILLYMLTGKTRGELRRGFIVYVKAKFRYVLCGVVAAGGVWLSLHFDDPNILFTTLALLVICLMFAWVFS